MTQNSYEKPEVAQAYDAKNSGRDDFEFYRQLAGELSTGNLNFAVLDIGCGTGALAVQIAAAGYRVTGVDPSNAMLDVARNRPGGDACTWIHGYANDVPDAVADLAVMTGHVAQYFLTKDAWVELLTEAYRALRPGGWLAFESRNPGRRAWERWVPEHTTRRLPHPDGGELTTWIELLDVDEDAPEGVLETHRGITIYPDGHRSGDDSSETLIFRPLEGLSSSLEAAGYNIEQTYGDFSRGPITEADPDSGAGASVEYIIIARRPTSRTTN
ncbi:class I SAM-dependent methyltransferase [Ornithinimicrobium sp. Y1694]|uniref:class I SAM-dependent methyltransferase n=1 Tax=Ornithinimicrobium sp. Y1694 TaxID=3418590 RepID=UPI003CF06838